MPLVFATLGIVLLLLLITAVKLNPFIAFIIVLGAILILLILFGPVILNMSNSASLVESTDSLVYINDIFRISIIYVVSLFLLKLNNPATDKGNNG